MGRLAGRVGSWARTAGRRAAPAARRALPAAVCAALALGGCAADGGAGAAYGYVAGTVPDDYQLQVARELGCPEGRIASMREHGMGVRDYSSLVPAADMLKAMEDRYGVDFRADWVNSGASWSLGCTAEEGPHAGESFTVEAHEQDDGSLKYLDDFFGAYRGDDFEAIAADAVGRAVEDAGAKGAAYALQATLGQKVDQAVPVDDPLFGGAGSYYGDCDVLFYGAEGPDAGQGGEIAAGLVERFEGLGMRSSFYIASYPGCEDAASAVAGLSSVEPAWHVLKAM